MASSTPSSCGLLDLAPEIRNYIYELVFSPNSAGMVNLVQPTPPSSALVKTCRQIRRESRLVFQAHYRRFWQETEFLVVLDPPLGREQRDEYYSAIRTRLSLLSAEDVGKICKMQFLHKSGGYAGTKCVLDSGLWIYIKDGEVMETLAPVDLQEEVVKAGCEHVTSIHNACITTFDGTGDLRDVKELLNGRRITKAELLDVLMHVADLTGGY